MHETPLKILPTFRLLEMDFSLLLEVSYVVVSTEDNLMKLWMNIIEDCPFYASQSENIDRICPCIVSSTGIWHTTSHYCSSRTDGNFILQIG